MQHTTPTFDFSALGLNNKTIACVDIGGSKIAVSLADTHGMHPKLVRPTCKTGAETAVAEQIIGLIEQVCKALGIAPHSVDTIGVSTTGPLVQTENGIHLRTPNICGASDQRNQAGTAKARQLNNQWERIPVQAPLQQHFPQAQVRIMMDAVAATVAEYRWGALRGMDYGAFVTWSTGVGAGICLHGKPLLGKNGNAGHLGHSFATSHGADWTCGCGNVGDVEGVCGGLGLTQKAQALGFTDLADMMHHAFAHPQSQSQSQSAQIVDTAVETMGKALYNLTVLFDLERIALGGSVFWHHRQTLLPRLQTHLQSRLPALTDGVELLPAQLGQQVGDYAALAVALHGNAN